MLRTFTALLLLTCPAWAAEVIPAPTAYPGGAAASSGSFVELAASLFGTVTIPVGATQVDIAGGSREFAVALPASAADGSPLHINVRTPAGQTSQVMFMPGSAAQSISDGLISSGSPLTLPVSQHLTFIYSLASNTWTLDGIGPAASLIADFVNGNYSVGYLTTPVSTTLTNLFSITNAGPATNIDSTGTIRDATANTWRTKYDIGQGSALQGYAIEDTATNTLTSGLNGSLITYPWLAEDSVTPAPSTDYPALYAGATYSGTIYKAPVPLSSDTILARLAATVSGCTTTASPCLFQAAVRIPASFSGSGISTSISGTNWSQIGPGRAADMTLRDQWQWVWSCGYQSTASNSATLAIRQAGATTSTDYVYLTTPMFANVAKCGPTSYIPTTSTTYVTRPADVVSPAAGNVLDALNGGTVLVDEYVAGSPPVSGVSGLSVRLQDPSSVNLATLAIAGDPAAPRVSLATSQGGTALASISGGVVSNGQAMRLGAALMDNDTTLTDSLGAFASAANALILPAISQVGIGAGSGELLRSVVYYPGRLSPLALASSIATAGPFDVTVNPSVLTGPVIPTDFVGLSLEVSSVSQTPALTANVGLKAMLGLLGSEGDVRFGGGTADTYLPTTSRVCNASQFVAGLGSGWTMTYGLSYLRNSPATEAAFAAQAVCPGGMTAANTVFQIGNEPDYYTSPAITETTYASQWATIAAAVSSAVSGARFAGPDIGQRTYSWIPSFIASLGSSVVELTKHLYAYANVTPYRQRSEIPALVNDQSADYFGRNFAALATAASLPIRLTESGCTATMGIGNTLGCGIWTLWEMATLASDGWAGVNFHESDAVGDVDSIGYVPLTPNGDGTYTAQPTFYSMVMFHQLSGGRVLPVATNGPKTLTSLGVLGADGKTRLLLINRDTTRRAIADVASTATWSTASIQLLTGPGYDATASITLGGASITPAGMLASSQIVSAKGTGALPNTAQVLVPPSSAALVTLQ